MKAERLYEPLMPSAPKKPRPWYREPSFLFVCVLALVAFALFAVACAHPQAGQTCVEGSAWCADAGVGLSCQGGVLVAYPCGGPKGCSASPGQPVLCDTLPGAPCFPAAVPQCSTDGTSLFQCASGTWTAAACPQGTRCASVDGGVSCK